MRNTANMLMASLPLLLPVNIIIATINLSVPNRLPHHTRHRRIRRCMAPPMLIPLLQLIVAPPCRDNKDKGPIQHHHRLYPPFPRCIRQTTTHLTTITDIHCRRQGSPLNLSSRLLFRAQWIIALTLLSHPLLLLLTLIRFILLSLDHIQRHPRFPCITRTGPRPPLHPGTD